MPDDVSQAAKPGTACLGCRRRKLKCSREEEGCSNCLKADLPCVYPTPEVGVKRKRGPYKKDKAPRERHLEDLVKYLEPQSEGASSSSKTPAGHVGGAEQAHSFRLAQTSNTPHHNTGPEPPHRRTGNSEDLVKDALIALTKSSVNDIETRADRGKNIAESARGALSLDAGLPGYHPSARRMFEYWEIFIKRVDPLMKIIHCPSFVKNIFAAIDRPKQLSGPLETLLFSIYYAAVSTCTAKESRQKFGESRSSLLERYSKTIEENLSSNYSIPTLESLQALVLYMIAIRRDNGDTNVRTLFSLAVRMAQLIGVDQDPDNDFSPFEAEMRRRLWWQICGLESRAAEEGVARQTSIMEDRNVKIPSNLDDFDLDPVINEMPVARIGVAEASFLVLRMEIVNLAHKLWAISKRFRLEGRGEDTRAIQREQRGALTHFRSKMQKSLLDHCDASRRYDWLLVIMYEAMSVKMHMIVEHPTTQVPTKEMSKDARFDLLQSSVTLIDKTLGISKSERLRDWTWYFRGYMQWHAVAIVIAELGRSTNPSFANNAWAVLDPVLRSWDETYKQKRDEPAWDHVNTLIEKARQMKKKSLPHRTPHAQPSPLVDATSMDSTGWRASSATDHPPAYQQAAPAPAIAPPSVDKLESTGSFAPNTISFLPTFSSALQPSNGGNTKMPSPDYGNTQILPLAETYGTVPLPDDGLGLASFDSLENIDFSAFDAVFGDSATWDSSPSMDWSWDVPVA